MKLGELKPAVEKRLEQELVAVLVQDLEKHLVEVIKDKKQDQVEE